jgi:predicted nuclease of predicted toxin-antitoxin system
MRPRFQADENLNARIIAGLLRRESSLDFQTAKAANLLGLEDLEVLTVAARDRRILVSHDRETMPAHFNRFIAESTNSGWLIVSQKLAIREAIEQILLVWAASEAEEWSSRIGYLPF